MTFIINKYLKRLYKNLWNIWIYLLGIILFVITKIISSIKGKIVIFIKKLILIYYTI